MERYRILVLTDLRSHKVTNSLYDLLPVLAAHDRSGGIDIASRSNPVNASFFEDLEDTPLAVAQAGTEFRYRTRADARTKWDRRETAKDYDAILLRLPRPVGDEFLSFLARIAPDPVIINDPCGIMRTAAKDFLLNFQELCPPMQLCRSTKDILEFAGRFPVVLKPLREYAGRGIVKIEEGKVDAGGMTTDLPEYLDRIETNLAAEGILAMQFLPGVKDGDKRILVVGGTIMGASLRLPPEGSWLCNVARGGAPAPADIDPEEAEIIHTLNPVLEREGILIYGADTLVGNNGKRLLSEINTLSVGGFGQAEALSGRPVLRNTVEKIIAYVEKRKGDRDNS